jgi:hypothetical protein
MIKLHGVYFAGNRLSITTDIANVTIELIGRSSDSAVLQVVAVGSTHHPPQTWPLSLVGQRVQVPRQRLLVRTTGGTAGKQW